MARYSDNREQNIEMKYIHKVLSKVDEGIELPPSLRGDALLPKLDGIQHPPPVSRKIRFSPKVFTWQSGLTYAAAFVLIVALSTVLTRNDSEILDVPAVPPGEEAAAVDVVDQPENPALDDAQLEEEAAPAGGQTAGQTPEDGAAADNQQAATADAPVAESGGGVGGANPSVKLGEYGGIAYTYRVNDATDPDKEGIPITISAADIATGELAFQIDLAGITTVETFEVVNGTAALVGRHEDGAAIRLYDVVQGEQPQELLSVNQPGAFLDAHVYKGILHVLTATYDASKLDWDTVQLPNSVDNSACLITSLDIGTMEINQKAFVGAGDASLYDLNVYAKYKGEVTDDHEDGQYAAQIKLDGTAIELGEIA